MFSERDHCWMQHAICLAKQAERQGEVPVGAVLVLEDIMIGEGHNCPIGDCDPTAHAEIMALRQGADNLRNYRLLQTTLYVTLEPCMMCVGAITHARVQRVVFGAFDARAGAVSSVFPIGEASQLNHRANYQGGLLAEHCGKMLSDFFRVLR